MARGVKTVQIAGELSSAAKNGIVASAEAIYDYRKAKSVEDLNQEVDTRLGNAETSLAAAWLALNNKQLEVGAVPTDARPTHGSHNIVESGSIADAIDYAVNDILRRFVKCTEEQYDTWAAQGFIDADTIYFIIEEE